MKKTALIASAFFIASPLFAGEPGTTAANFLKLAVNPRAIAMGEAQTGLSDDVYAAYWNPAGLTQLETPEAGLVHAELLEGVRSEYVAYAHPVAKWGTVAGSVTHLQVGTFESFDAGGQSIGQVGASDTAVAASFARPLISRRRMGSELSVGATGKWIRERLDTSVASAYAMDAGVLYVPGRTFGEHLDGFRAGLAVRNVGTAMTFDQDSFQLPRTASVGASWTGLWLGERLTVALDADKASDHHPTLGGGIELSTLRLFILRAGYTTKSDLGNGVRLGAGLRFRTLQLDYAYAGASRMGQMHRIGLTCRFGTLPPDPLVLAQSAYARGLKASRRAQYTEALVHFNKALEIDPSHPEALAKMKETYEKLKTTTPH